ncbi:rhodanese-like domain-containing protein [Halobacillus salinus]|uniref:Rhodanese-like domain-containing protein n=1 Tax=Halobacillus salinus TaxID=192814 RepID=A0A4Z0GZP9_9BACI|nr:rhodanese-like domain-containing protein [Halobacillus salinus]TGB02855.1 rhodanese-like domain-containing protein [Halobacillus salinus]
MDLFQWVIALVFVFLIVKWLMPAKGISTISGAEVQQLTKDKKTQFIDVRTTGEFKRNHRKPFKNIPLSDLNKRSSELNKEESIVLLCQSGMRSMKAAKQLKKQGFTKIINVRGGLGGWQ